MTMGQKTWMIAAAPLGLATAAAVGFYGGWLAGDAEPGADIGQLTALNSSAISSPGSIPNANEPAGFTTAWDLQFDPSVDIASDHWTFIPAKGVPDGDVYYTTRDGRNVIEFRYEAGQSDGYPGGNGRVVYNEGRLEGQYNYYRFEDVWVDEDFYGHVSGVNKYQFLSFTDGTDQVVIILFGSGSGPLRPTITMQGALASRRYSPNYTSDDGNPNRAPFNRGEDEFTRGEYHTIEVLWDKGTPGNADGWFRLWLDEVEIMHYQNVNLLPPTGPSVYRGLDFGPIWGGVGDNTPQEMFLRSGRLYGSYGDSI